MYPKLCLLLILSLAAVSVGAREWRAAPRFQPPPAAEQRDAQHGSGPGLDAAVEAAERETGGRVLSARSELENGRWIYRIKVLTAAGRVRMLSFDGGGGRR